MTAIPKRNAPTPRARTVYDGADLRYVVVVVGIPRAVAANERHDPAAKLVCTKNITMLSTSSFLSLSLFSFSRATENALVRPVFEHGDVSKTLATRAVSHNRR